MYAKLKTYFDAGPRITLPGIREEITLPGNTWFRYDGEVASLSENIYRTQLAIRKLKMPRIGMSSGILDETLDSIIERFSKPFAMADIRSKVSDADTTAVCTKHLIEGEKVAYVIAMKKGLSESNKIFAAGHESGELLNAINQRTTLQTFLEKEEVHLDSSKYEGEDFADIAGLLALKKAKQTGNIEIRLPIIETRQSVVFALANTFQLNPDT